MPLQQALLQYTVAFTAMQYPFHCNPLHWVKQSTLPFQGAVQGLFSKVTLEKADRVLDYITMTGQDRNTNSDQICLLTQEEYEIKYPNKDATRVLMVEGVTINTDGKKVRYADAVDEGIGGGINRSIAIETDLDKM